MDQECRLLFDTGLTLKNAVSDGNFKLIEILLQAGADVNTPGILSSAIAHDVRMSHGTMLPFMLGLGARIETHGGEALREAVAWGDFETVQFLLLSGVDVNDEEAGGDFNNKDLTILQIAVSITHIELVKILLDAGADVNALSRYGRQTALEIAVWQRQGLEIVQVLLAAGADANFPKSILQTAISFGNEALVSILLKEGADVNNPPIETHGRSPVQEAAQKGKISLIKLLLEFGANINAPAGEDNGRTAIQAAISARLPKIELIKFLLDAGANINAPAGKRYGRTTIQAASSSELATMELIDFLLDAGADINAQAGYDRGVTALQGAAICGHMRIALKFLEAGADVNAAAALSMDGQLLMAPQSMAAWIWYICFSTLVRVVIQRNRIDLMRRLGSHERMGILRLLVCSSALEAT